MRYVKLLSIVCLLFLLVLDTSAVNSRAGTPAARQGDMHTCPMVTGTIPHVGGPISTGDPTVLICGQPAARVGDEASCVGPTDTIVHGSTTVLIGGIPAARMGSATAHGGVVTQGCSSVQIGG